MKRLLTLFLLLTLFSCSKDPVAISKFKGNWEGAFTGADDNGTFKVVIDEHGSATGSATSSIIMQSFQLNGVVTSNGALTMTFGTATSGGTFSGVMNGRAASGTWENKMTNPTFSGNWTGQQH